MTYRGIVSHEFVNRAKYCFIRLKELGAKGVFMINKNTLSIVGTEQPLSNPVNDNEAKA